MWHYSMESHSHLTLFHLGSGMTLSPGGGGGWPALVFSHITQGKVMPTPKTCSLIIFLIFRHLLKPLFQQSRKSDPPFLSVNFNQCMHSETSKIAKTPKGPPYEKKNIFVSDFAEILCVTPFDQKDFKIWYFFQKKFFNFNVENFKFFWKKCWK